MLLGLFQRQAPGGLLCSGNSEKSKKKENKKLSGHSPCYFDDKSTIHTSPRPFESNYKILR